MPEKDKINYDMLPDYMRRGARLYVEDGVIPGDFLTYIFKNDFVHAACHADDVNKYLLFTYAGFLYNEVPSGCWGSKTKMLKWNKEGGLNGPEKAQG